MPTKNATECSRCGNPFTDEELECLHGSDDVPICDECFHEHFEFTCCDCCEYGHVDDQHNMLVVFEECDSMGGPSRVVVSGIYRIADEGAYFGGPIIGSGYLFGNHLKRIADVNPDMDGNGYPCGHLCKECQEKVLAQFNDKCSACHKPSGSCLLVKLGSWKDSECKKYQWSKPTVLCAACRYAHRGSWKIV